MIIEHVVFDFDGVIVDSEKEKFRIVKEILQDKGHTISDSLFPQFVGKKRAFFLEEIGVSKISEIMQEIHEKDSLLIETPLVSGVCTFLDFLKSKHIPAHIATGSSRNFVTLLLEKHGLVSYFATIITSDEIKESKPNPRIYLEMKRLLGSSNILVIEDSRAGVESAKNAGVVVLGLGKNTGAEQEFDSFKELQNYFENNF